MTKEEFESLSLGATFELGCRTFKVVKITKKCCEDCFFYNKNCGDLVIMGFIPSCNRQDRNDETEVRFVEVEDYDSKFIGSNKKTNVYF